MTQKPPDDQRTPGDPASPPPKTGESALRDGIAKAEMAAQISRIQAETAAANAAEARLEAEELRAALRRSRSEAETVRAEADALRKDLDRTRRRNAGPRTEENLRAAEARAESLKREEQEFARDRKRRVGKVALVAPGRLDARGQTITKVYAMQSDEYAVYKAGGDVMVHFADDVDLAAGQRRDILTLGSAKADLNALLHGMAEGKRGGYDARMATALQQCLEDDKDATAKQIMASAYADALLQRSADGRIQYLVSAVFCAAVAVILLTLAQDYLMEFKTAENNLWLAGRAGIAGALLSIGIGIRRRTVAIDLYRWSNVAEGALRLLIGMICAGFLLMGLTSGILPEVSAGDVKLIGEGMVWQAVLVVGFVAGFLERLIPDLLEKTGPQPPKEVQQTSAPVGAGSASAA
jgi:hypothetical protein